jgi:lysozyme family protein
LRVRRVGEFRRDAVRKWLQRALGVTVDGHIGDHTLLAAKDADHAALVRSICDQRMKFLRSLRTFPTFGKGWTRRVNDVRATALGMVGEEVATPEQVMTGAKAAKADLAQPVVSQGAATAATAGTASASAVIQQIQKQLAPYSETLTAVKYALIAVAVIGLGFTIYSIWKSNRLKEFS